MGKLRVSSFAVSIDDFGAGPDQDLQNPIGVGGTGEALFLGIDLPALGYESVKHVAGERATHVFLKRRAS